MTIRWSGTAIVNFLIWHWILAGDNGTPKSSKVISNFTCFLLFGLLKLLTEYRYHWKEKVTRLLLFRNISHLLLLNSSDLRDVIKRANATQYGLAAGVFTNNVDTANTLSRALRAGTVWVNCFDVFDAAIPFGGYKMSGIGREKGIYSLSNYLQVKAVVTPLKNPAWL